ncbi:circularly permuted type 2 ATP-grasp protein [Okeania sp. SIO1H5]|uniref:circularly permuted type 2 ATP-grasp protein n=1 Tax=Okeania sp. SIO1H5 TaxID=2607777 RepID=UPI0035C8D167
MMLPEGNCRSCSLELMNQLDRMGMEELKRRQHSADRAFMTMGITFNVYKSGMGVEKIFPFDVIPRIVPAEDWEQIETGLKQRVQALNLFIDDIYHRQQILRDGVIPREVVESSKGFLKECIGINPPKGIWCHINGPDLIRHSDGSFYVLEDNLRVPSGVSYVLGNRRIMKSSFSNEFQRLGVRSIHDYPHKLKKMLQYLSDQPEPVVAVLTPGIYNSAYFEHSSLANEMGVQLVEGSDLVVNDQGVCMRTISGLKKIDVIYRRLDDQFIDPTVFRPESLLGVPGLFTAWAKGQVALANALGTGIADDKVVYAYVPSMIRYYLDQEAILPNVPTFLCWDEKQRQHVLENLDSMVVKPANESGGYGMLVGPKASKKEIEEFRHLIASSPRNYVAQPTMSLSRVPTVVQDRLEGRHVDLRPFVLHGEDTYVIPGGLTRVALTKGSLVVNSSQGGGSKDTWVLQKPTGDAPC